MSRHSKHPVPLIVFRGESRQQAAKTTAEIVCPECEGRRMRIFHAPWCEGEYGCCCPELPCRVCGGIGKIKRQVVPSCREEMR